MDLKNTETRIKMLPILALIFQVLSFIFLFVGNAIKKVNVYYGISGDPTDVDIYKKSIHGAATTSFDLGGDPQVKYAGHEFWFYSFMILLIISMAYTVFCLVKKNNLLSQKISSLVMAGISLYGMIMAIVVGTVKKVRVYDLDSLYGSGAIGQKCYHELLVLGYMFIVFSVIIIILKVLEFFLALKKEKAQNISEKSSGETNIETPEKNIHSEVPVHEESEPKELENNAEDQQDK